MWPREPTQARNRPNLARHNKRWRAQRVPLRRLRCQVLRPTLVGTDVLWRLEDRSVWRAHCLRAAGAGQVGGSLPGGPNMRSGRAVYACGQAIELESAGQAWHGGDVLLLIDQIPTPIPTRFGMESTNLDRHRPAWDRDSTAVGPDSTKFDPESAHFGPTSTEVEPTSTKFGPPRTAER